MAIKGYWKLNGNSNDYSGNGYNGTDTAITYSQANGRLGQGAGFNGSSSKITTTYSSSIASISFWVRLQPSGWTGDWNIIVEQIKLNTSYGFTIRREASNYRSVISVGNKSGSDSFSNYVIPTLAFNNTWYHVVISQNTDIRVFVNSKLEIIINDDWGTAGNLLLGCSSIPYGSRYLLGSLDEVIIDNTPWSAAKVKNEYARVKGFF